MSVLQLPEHLNTPHRELKKSQYAVLSYSLCGPQEVFPQSGDLFVKLNKNISESKL